MSQALTRLMLVLLLAVLCARAAVSQTTLEWIVLSPARESFTARVPMQPVAQPQRVETKGLNASGLRYAVAADEGATFVIWSMEGSHAGGALGGGDRAAKRYYDVAPYLDEVAELAWELLVTPELERIKREEVEGEARRIAEAGVGMSYVRGFNLGGKDAREYTVRLQKEGGYVYVCADGARAYVVAAHGPAASAERLRQFVNSFAFKGVEPEPASGIGTGSGSGSGGGPVNTGGGDAPVDYSRPFKQSEVTKKAVLTFKPEPGFTEQARRFNVVGTVRLRAILHSSGMMQSIAVVKGMPHGLTEKSIAAARQIRFEPAQKDGRAVSQYVVLEYNYNIY